MVSIFIPAFNEEKNLINTVSMCLEALSLCAIDQFEIIVVNDGSTDKTREIVDRLALENRFIVPVHNDKNQGLGYSFRKALGLSRYPKFFVIPGDNDLSTSLIEKLLTRMGKADLILLYFLNRETRGRKRNLISILFSTIYMLTFSIFVQYINGGVIYNTEKLKELDLFSNRFSIIVEATIKSLCSGCTYYEVGGYMQRGLEGSTSFSLKNLVEVILSYLRLVYTIKIAKQFNSNPRRIF